MYRNIAVIFAFVFAYSLVAGRLERTPVAGAILFTAFGFLCGPVGLGLVTFQIDAQGLRTLAELTLALVLFTDAAGADLAVLRRNRALPERLLLIGLPLTILLGALVGAAVFPHLAPLELALLGTMLAPTDAALGKPVIVNPAVPAPIREGLNVESGLNDGICVPVLLVLLALATEAGSPGETLGTALRHFVAEIGIGALVGATLTFLAVHALRLAGQRGWTTETWRQLTVIALALTCFALAQATGGSGFIACFVGGLLAGAMGRRHKHAYLLAAEGAGNLLTLATWVAFGSVVVGQAIGRLSWNVVAYAVLSLTLVRILPVLLALAGSRLTLDARLFVGWFGPRGLASIVFAVIVLDARLPGSDTLTAAVACTVILSILAHGLSANPLATALAGRSRGDPAAKHSPRP